MAVVTRKCGGGPTEGVTEQLRQHVGEKIGAIAKPEKVILAADLPKTRSGKIMRRLLRDIAEGRTASDTTTLADPSVFEMLRERYEETYRS